MLIKLWLHSFAKTGLGGWLLQIIFSSFSFAVPGEKLLDNPALTAFHHPSPAYPLHILIVPKSRMVTLQDLPSPDQNFERALFEAVNQLVTDFDLGQSGYRLITNGGKYQEVNHLHFHLVCEDYQITPADKS